MVAVRQDEFERLCKAGLINFGAEKKLRYCEQEKESQA